MELQLPKGMKDSLPEEKINRQELMDLLRAVFELYGFNPLETPAIERFEILSSKYAGGSEILKETFAFKDQGGRELGLRYDLTVPFSRVVGMNPQLKMPWKRYQMEKVWRDGPIGLGRYREFWQCDVDVVGCKDMLADAEIIAITSNVFERLGLKTEIRVNSRKLINGVLRYIGVTSDTESIILTLDKLRKIGEDNVKRELNEKGVSSFTADKILEILTMEGDEKELLKKLKGMIKDDEGLEGIKELESIFEYINCFGLKNVKLDLSLARGLAFYTSTVFETFLIDSDVKSAVASGGRYDKIIGKFIGTDKEYPAVGISFGLDRIYDAIKSKGSFPEKKSVVKVYVIPFKNMKETIKLVQNLRKECINSDMDLVKKSVSKNLDYANKLNIPYVIFVGDKELKQGKFKLRDMKTGKEKLLTEKGLVKALKG